MKQIFYYTYGDADTGGGGGEGEKAKVGVERQKELGQEELDDGGRQKQGQRRLLNVVWSGLSMYVWSKKKRKKNRRRWRRMALEALFCRR